MPTCSTYVLDNSSEDEMDFICAACEDRDSIAKCASIYCKSCVRFYCEQCNHVHKQLFRYHNTFGRGEIKEFPASKYTEDLRQKCVIQVDAPAKTLFKKHEQFSGTVCSPIQDSITKKRVLIVVNKVFKDDPAGKRQGATKDYKQMCWMFGELGFYVTPRLNLKAREIKEELESACSKHCDCFVFVISSHGEEVLLPGTTNVYVYDQTVLGSDGEAVSVNDLFKCMDTGVLKGTPKLCFIQACRTKAQKGNTSTINAYLEKLDEGLGVDVCEPTINDGPKSECKTRKDKSRATHKRPWYDDSVITLLNEDSFTCKNTDDIRDATAAIHIATSEQFKGDDNPFNLSDSDDDDADDESDAGGSFSGAAGGGDFEAMPNIPFDVAPVDCPKGFLVMYSVQPHKLAFRCPTQGSLMFYYMFENRKELKKHDGKVLVYLTYVARAMANHTSNFKGKEVKMCGTIYHRLTTNVIMKYPSQLTRQMFAFKAALKRHLNAITRI